MNRQHLKYAIKLRQSLLTINGFSETSDSALKNQQILIDKYRAIKQAFNIASKDLLKLCHKQIATPSKDKRILDTAKQAQNNLNKIVISHINPFLTEFINETKPPPPGKFPLKQMIAEVSFLEKNYPKVVCNPIVLQVYTEPVVLFDDLKNRYELGRYIIQLPSVITGNDPGYWFIVEPEDTDAPIANPRGNPLTHPHVFNNKLCFGEGIHAVKTMMNGGFLAETINIINSILHQVEPNHMEYLRSLRPLLIARDAKRKAATNVTAV